jgi:ribosomal protein S18 acetylase RimI-like enzyme
VVIRDLRHDETSFLGDMLCAALAWKPGRRLPPKALLLRIPQVSIFHEGWGRPGDTGLVAEQDQVRLGLVWYRMFTDASHGEGFVDPQTPEIAVAVVEGHRGKGLGSALMKAAHDRARAQGIRRISLSVDHDNPARRLYERLGYMAIAEREDDDRMVLDLI